MLKGTAVFSAVTAVCMALASCADKGQSTAESSSEERYGTFLPRSVTAQVIEHTGDNEMLMLVHEGDSSTGINKNDTIKVKLRDSGGVDNTGCVLDESSLTLDEVGMIDPDSLPEGTWLCVEFEDCEVTKEDGITVIDTDWQAHAINNSFAADAQSMAESSLQAG